jgi:hypothetical protein
MLFTVATLDGIASGRVTLAFRRWRRPTVRAGGRLRTAVGELAVDAVDAVDESALNAAAARRAGFASRAELSASLGDREGQLYRIAFRLAGPDARIALRDTAPDADQMGALRRRLDRLDAHSRRGPWTRTALRLIAARPAIRAGDLAKAAGVDTAWFKINVRKLKELGLTESLEVGYRLSPRGAALLAAERAAT